MTTGDDLTTKKGTVTECGCGESMMMQGTNEDYNVKLEYVESRDNPACHIYKVSVN